MPDTNAFVASIYRKGKPFIPSGDTLIKENDEVYFISSEASIDQIVNEFRDKKDAYSRVMIIGGGKIGFSLAKELEVTIKQSLLIQIKRDVLIFQKN
jgi:trk system potassium uptake protein TrkA